jgi:hypothetical protein
MPNSTSSDQARHSGESPVPGFDDFEQQNPPRRRRTSAGEWFGRLFLIALVVALGAGALFALNFLNNRPAPQPTVSGPPPFFVPTLPVQRAAAVPGPASVIPLPDAPFSPPKETFQGWVRSLAYKTDLPERVLVAYAKADLAIQASNPRCHLTWATLAGVGRIESKHGRYGGAEVNDNGEESKRIIGPALDGSPGFLAVPDTDKGELDGDTVWDHAVGPMQFTPETWRRYGMRASKDGKQPDPQSIDDSSLTAGRYLCAMGGDLSVPKNWWTAVLTYNNSTEYGQQVFSNADAYGKSSLGKN